MQIDVPLVFVCWSCHCCGSVIFQDISSSVQFEISILQEAVIFASTLAYVLPTHYSSAVDRIKLPLLARQFKDPVQVGFVTRFVSSLSKSN